MRDGLQHRTTDLWIGPVASFPDWRQSLSRADLEEAARFSAPAAASRHLMARAAVRTILASYTGVPASRLRFCRGSHGKPHLPSNQAAPLHFNVSHSHDRLAVAVSRHAPLGVDVEHIRPLDAAWLARSWFSSRELAAWRALPRVDRLAAFFRLWCRKEAFIKAAGQGLALRLDSFSVSSDPGRARLIEVRGRAPRRWRLTAIDAGSGYAAALATLGHPGLIVRRELP